MVSPSTSPPTTTTTTTTSSEQNKKRKREENDDADGNSMATAMQQPNNNRASNEDEPPVSKPHLSRPSSPSTPSSPPPTTTSPTTTTSSPNHHNQKLSPPASSPSPSTPKISTHQSIRNEIKQGNIQNLLTEQESLASSSTATTPTNNSNSSSTSTPITTTAQHQQQPKISNLRDKSYVVDSNEAIHLKLVKTVEDINDDEESTFYPNYTYQLFGEDEQIMGYKNLRIDIYYVASTLYTLVRMNYDQKLSSAPEMDPISVLTRKKIEWDDKSALPIPPNSYTPHLEEFIAHVNDAFVPPGQQLTAYTLSSSSSSSSSSNSVFEVYHGTFMDDRITKYHERLQTFTLFFIDGANYIDSTDPKWEIFLLFEKYKNSQGETKYAIVGYTTVYHFYAYPDQTRLRISQFIILPPYQKQGHGSKLLNAVYTSAKSPSNKVLEVCVEDPSEQFQAMRDLVDYRNFYEMYGNELPSDGWTDEFGNNARKELKINLAQLRKCYEIGMLEKIKVSSANRSSSRDKNGDQEDMLTDLMTQYRLDIKRRLYKSYDMDKSALDEEERKRQLHELYTQIEEEYMDVIKKCHHK